MISLILRFALIVVLAMGFAWLADQPGDLTLRWLGYEIQTSLMAAAITLAIVVTVLWITWSVLIWLLDRPGALGSWFRTRRQQKGHDAISNGLIAVAAGDKDAAQSNARTATAVLGNDPMARLLDAQAAQMRGDSARVNELFEEMANQPETRLLGLRGLHTEAVRKQDMERARHLAEEAARLNPRAGWASSAVLSYQSASKDWPAITRTIDQQKQARLIDRSEANARHAVVLTAQAMELLSEDPARAGELAREANKLEPSLVPAAVLAARQAAKSGNLRKASRIIEKTWALVPHPDLAEVYGELRAGDSALDRLKRIRSLTARSSGIEAAVALAIAAIDAQEWKAARKALEPYAHDRPQARICGLMAQIEEGEFRDKGRAREWLARAVRAPRDPAWTADGYISRNWLPVSPVTGELGAFRWRVPVEGIADASSDEDDDIANLPAYDDDNAGYYAEVMPGDDAIPVNPKAGEQQPAPASTDTAPPAAGVTATEDIRPGNAVDAEAFDNRPAEAEDNVAPEPVSRPVAEIEKPMQPADPAVPDADDGTQVLKLRQPDDPGPDDPGADEPEKKTSRSWL